MTAVLRREGWIVNVKRVHRLCRKEGLKVRRNRRKQRAVGASTNACHVKRAEFKDHVWTWDFAFDRTKSGTTLKWLSIVDEYTRECLALKVDRSITSEDVVNTLAELFAMRGVPQAIRSDNGPEFVSRAIQAWLEKLQIQTLYVAPGSPWENGYAESFHSKLRDEFLQREVFETLSSARRQTQTWNEDYNHHRPHSSLGYVPPSEFAARCAASATELLPATPPATPPLQPHNGLTQPALS